MSRRSARAACRGAALTCLLAAGTVLLALTAQPAQAANERLGPMEGADLESGLTYGEGILLFVAAPLALLLLLAAVTLLPGASRRERYRPGRAWSAAPVWFSGPPEPVAAVETAEPVATTRGGASGSW